MRTFGGLAIWIILLSTHFHQQVASDKNICRPAECLLIKECRCAVGDHPVPGGLNKRKDIPHFVMLTFQGKLTTESYKQILKVINGTNTPESGCPKRATFFIPGVDNDWSAVKKLHAKGHEIAAYSNSFTTRSDYWKQIDSESMQTEATDIRKTIYSKAKIPKKEIKGWRTPLLEFRGDTMMRALKETEFKYDSTLRTDQLIWPFTMDYGWPFENCNRFTDACISQSYKSFWEIPVIIQENPEDKKDIMATLSDMKTNDAAKMYNILKHNFERFYDHDHRVPFMMVFKTSWFLDETGKQRVKAVGDFLSYISGKKDVFIMTITDVLQWIKQPVLAADMQEVCENKVDQITLEPFDYKRLSRYERYLYYYGRRKNSASFTSFSVAILLLLPLSLFLSSY